MIADLLKPETFGFFARYLLAGFIILSAQSRSIGQVRLDTGEMLIGAVILSLVNQLIYQLASRLWPGIPVIPAVGEPLFYVEILALPACLGLISAWLIGRNWVPPGLRTLIFPFSRPVPEAFELAFVEASSPCFVVITYADGREVLGYFGLQSYVGTDQAAGGIYLEKLYVLGSGGDWEPAQPERSVWLSLRDARSIEFVDPEGEHDAENPV